MTVQHQPITLPTLPLRRLAAAAGCALALLLGLGVLAPGPAPSARAQGELIAYTKVAQWPERTSATQGLFQTPADLDISRDGRVFIADPGIGGIHTLLPSGSFSTPFGVTGGFPAQLGQVGALAVGPDPTVPGFPFSAERVYVIDGAVDRVAFYGLDGRYQGQWPNIRGQGIAAASDGAVYILDRETTQVRAYDPVAGVEKWAWGTRGTDDGQFSSFTDVSVSADGKVLVIGDKRGQRVQLFDVAAQVDVDAGQPPLKLRKVYDLRDAKYTQQNQTCSGARVNALGADQVFMGEGPGACLVDGRNVTFAIAASANKNTICRASVTLPRLRADTQQYFALADSDPNPGKCGEKQGTKDTTPVIVKYNDTALRQVTTVYEAASNDDSKNPVLFQPESLSMSDADTIFIGDSSSKFRLYSKDGRQLATSARDTQSGSFGGDFQFFRIQNAVAADTPGEVFGYYINGQRSGAVFSVKAGIGRFKTVEKRGQNGIEEVIEPVWTDELATSFQQVEIGSVAFNPVTKELLAVRTVTVPQQRTSDVRLVRYDPNGRKLNPTIDLPDDGESNPYVDLVVGPDGRIYLLDDLNDLVHVFEADGSPVRDVPVAFDARAVAAGPPSPEGAVFVLREPGSIERYADDGRVTARLDGRPLEFSDPTTLTDLVVDGDGRVYVADGQSSLITVLASAATPEEIPIPDDGTCLFKGRAAVDPTRFDLGETTKVSLQLDGRCGTDEDPTDIVVVIPYYRRLQQGTDPSATAINDMLRLMARVNFSKHRVGIVSYYNTVTTELPLTGDRAAYMAKARDITRSDPANQQVKARLRDAMEEGAKLFTDPTRRRVMVLLRADYCDPAFERFPGQCTGYPPAEDVALAIRESGVSIVAVISFSAFQLASSDEDALFTTDGVHRRMVRYRLPDALAKNVTLTHQLPGNMTVDPTSISNGGRWQMPSVVWSSANVGWDGLAGAMTLRPTAGGTWPVAVRSTAELTDGWGKAQTVSFPIPQVEVIGLAPTTVPPTATPLPPTATPTSPTVVPPTAVAKPKPVFLPITHVGRCKAVPVPLEVALVLDISSSMNAATRPGGPTKLRAAKDAAEAFVRGLRSQDRVALVAFNDQVRRVTELTSDHGAVAKAIEALTTGSGTRIELGLLTGQSALEQRRPGTQPVLLLLTDGRPSSSVDSVQVAGNAVRAAGTTVYTIGLGADVDGALLQQVAGSSGRYYFAPSTDDLQPVFDELLALTELRCE